MDLKTDGAVAFAATSESRAWAQAAYKKAAALANDEAEQARHLRHGGTWFVGVDALPNATDGAIAGTPFTGPWAPDLPVALPLHPAQLSIIYPGYPVQDADQSIANHRYRLNRSAAHVDGLLPEGQPPRRFAREFHAYILGIHLNAVQQAPTVYWRGSHKIMHRALSKALAGGRTPEKDVTDAYQSARKEVFERCEKVPLLCRQAGDAFLLDPFTLHGTDPWDGPEVEEGRMIAFFRPAWPDAKRWLSAFEETPEASGIV